MEPAGAIVRWDVLLLFIARFIKKLCKAPRSFQCCKNSSIMHPSTSTVAACLPMMMPVGSSVGLSEGCGSRLSTKPWNHSTC